MLQGSLSDFTLDEMLGLLATTQKTGQMRIDGDRGAGAIWLADGSLAAARLGAEERPIEDALFELLRFNSGTFSFNAGAQAPAGSEHHDLDAVLDAALARVAEWRTVEAVVPSMAHVLAPAEVAPTPQVTLDMDEWATMVAVGERSTVQRVCDRLGLGEVDGSRRMKMMIERALLSINEPGSTPSVRPKLAGIAAVAAPAETLTAVDAAAAAGIEVADEPAVDFASAFGAEAHSEEPASPFASAPTAETPVIESGLTSRRAFEVPDVEVPAPPAAVEVPAPPAAVEVPAPPAAVETPAPVVAEAATPPMPVPPPPAPAAPSAEVADFSATEPVGFGDGRPPVPPPPAPPAPPSPAEIASFGEELQRSEGLNSEELADVEAAVETNSDGPSLLMRYLKSDSK